MFLASSSSTLADTLVGPAFELAPDCLGGDGLDDDDLRDLDFDLDLRLSRDLERRRWDFFLDSLRRRGICNLAFFLREFRRENEGNSDFKASFTFSWMICP